MKRKGKAPESVTGDNAPMMIGYARVSTDEQDVDHQVRALKAAGCHHIYTDTVSGRAKRHRFMRNRLVCELRRDDPGYWTYVRLAFVVHCSPELIAKIIREEGTDAWADSEG